MILFSKSTFFQEEHCAIISYPGDEFAGHVVPPAGTGKALAEEIGQFIKDRGVEMQSVKSLVSDGCEKMVGWEKGVHASLEKIFKVPFGRIICFFHHLEKSFEVILLLYSGRLALWLPLGSQQQKQEP